MWGFFRWKSIVAALAASCVLGLHGSGADCLRLNKSIGWGISHSSSSSSSSLSFCSFNNASYVLTATWFTYYYMSTCGVSDGSPPFRVIVRDYSRDSSSFMSSFWDSNTDLPAFNLLALAFSDCDGVSRNCFLEFSIQHNRLMLLWSLAVFKKLSSWFLTGVEAQISCRYLTFDSILNKLEC